jgi:SAM-dependent methyltransferase
MKSITRAINSRILKRWGSFRVRSKIWNDEFAAGLWNYIDHTVTDPIYGLIEKYSNNGAILDVGCGTGNTSIEVKVEKYTKYRGVDISQVAIDKAVSRSRDNGRAHVNSYVCADMLSYVPDEKYDLIVFRECLWYVRRSQALGMLRRYADFLKGQGKFLVSICPPAAQRQLGPVIEREFQLVEKFVEKRRGLIAVFR